MIFTPLPLAGAYVVDVEHRHDERGFFGRTFCTDEFAQHGLNGSVRQCSVSFNEKRGTLRGMHFQLAPHDEEKIVRCTGGAIFDVIVDLRPDSPTRRQWYGLELTADNHRSLYVPRGFAHGFLSLSDGAEVFYMISVPYAPGFTGGFRWNDPAVGIRWPAQPVVLAARDAQFPLLDDAPLTDGT